MKNRSLLLLTGLVVAFNVGIAAEPKKAPQKSESESAYSEWSKVVNNREAKRDQAQFDAVISGGVKLLVKHATSGRAVDVVRDLSTYPLTQLSDKANAGQRGVYMSALRYQIINARTEDGVTDQAKVALAALDAAAADTEVKMQPNKANLDQLREKIDALAAMPGSSKFLVVREASYADILAKVQSPARAEAYLRKLAEHDDKAVAEMAKKELDFLEVKKAPLDFKATTLDGKEVDLAQLRGKVVALYFWSFTNQNATKGLDALQEVYSFNRKAGFEVVTVSTDKAEDREKLAKYVKENRLNFPVVFDGKGSKTDIAQKLNTTSVPRLTLLDRQGMILTVNLPLNQLDAAVKQYTAKGK